MNRDTSTIRVLMVCLGNICRSPTAHGVFQRRIEVAGLEQQLQVDSAGTGNYHIGAKPDERSIAAAALRGYRLDNLRARQVAVADFEHFDYVIAMDRTNLKDLRLLCPPTYQNRLKLFMDYSDSQHDVVPDPYYSGVDGFELVLDLVEEAASNLLNAIVNEHFPDHASVT